MQLPLGLGRSIGIRVLERTEAVLDSLLQIPPPPGLEMLVNQSMVASAQVHELDDDSEDDVEDVPRRTKSGRISVPRSLPLFRMFEMKLSSGSHTLQVTVISVQDTYSSLLERVGATKVWEVIKNLHAAEVKREIVGAARDPPAAAAKAITYLGCERSVGSVLERVVTSRLVTKLLGSRPTEWASSWLSKPDDSMSRAQLELPTSSVTIEDVDDYRRPLRQMTEQDVAMAMGLRLVVKNSFIELVPEDGDFSEDRVGMRRSQSCGANMLRQFLVIDASGDVHPLPVYRTGSAPAAAAPAAAPVPAPAPAAADATRGRSHRGCRGGSSTRSAVAAPAVAAPAVACWGDTPPLSPSASVASLRSPPPSEPPPPPPLCLVAWAAAEDRGHAAWLVPQVRDVQWGTPAAAFAFDAEVAALSAGARAALLESEGSHTALEEDGPRTTVMLRNLPLDLIRDDFLRQLDATGFACRYGFVYLPRDFTRRRGLGYALVGAISPEVALDMLYQLQGHDPDGQGAWQVSWSEPNRSVAEHVERYRNSPVMHASMPDEYKPIIFFNGLRMPFPPPTKVIRPPRIRHMKPGEDQDLDSMPVNPLLSAAALAF